MLTKTIKLENKSIRMQLWDTAGQERFKCLIPSYIKQAFVSIIVYDITSNAVAFYIREKHLCQCQVLAARSS